MAFFSGQCFYWIRTRHLELILFEISMKLQFKLIQSTCCIHFLLQTFDDQIISRSGTVNWTPISSDLSALDYFLQRYVKSIIYHQRTNKARILTRKHKNHLKFDIITNVLWFCHYFHRFSLGIRVHNLLIYFTDVSVQQAEEMIYYKLRILA